MSDDPPTPPWTEAPGSTGAPPDDRAEPAGRQSADGGPSSDGHAPPADGTTPADRIRRADGLLVLVDFDGTLADIRPRPDQATIRPESREALAALADLSRTAVAVVSGRGLADVRERVDLPGIGYAGNHGLEIETPEREFVHPEAEGAALTVAAVCADLRDRLADVEGVIVEEKNLSATVHYREVAEAEVDRVREAVRATVEEHATSAASEGEEDAESRGDGGALRVEEGKQIVELKPDVDWDKGRAVEWLRDVFVPDGERWHPVYVGDDVTDEDAFRALAGEGTTIRVGAPDEPTAADFRVDDPDAIPPLLAWIADVQRG